MRREVILLILVFAVVWIAHRAAARGFAQPQGNPPAAAVVGSVDAIKRTKLEAAKQAYELVVDSELRGGPAGRSDVEDRCTWSRRWMEAERDTAADEAGRRRAVVAHLERMKPMLAVMERRQEAGMISARDVASMRYFLAEAELWAKEAGGKGGGQ